MNHWVHPDRQFAVSKLSGNQQIENNHNTNSFARVLSRSECEQMWVTFTNDYLQIVMHRIWEKYVYRRSRLYAINVQLVFRKKAKSRRLPLMMMRTTFITILVPHIHICIYEIRSLLNESISLVGKFKFFLFTCAFQCIHTAATTHSTTGSILKRFLYAISELDPVLEYTSQLINCNWRV